MGIPNCTGSEKRWGCQICIDFRKLNQNTQKDAPRIDETVDALDGLAISQP